MAIVDDVGGQSWLVECDVEGVASSHTPAYRANAILLYIRLRLQELERGLQVSIGAVVWDPAHQFMRHIWRSGNFATI